MLRADLTIIVMLLAGALSACASDDHGGPGDRRQGHEGPLPNVFISPEGKPYHAASSAPYAVALWFADADTDHDGRLTAAEFRADADAFFRVLDANHDGVLDGQEVGDYEQSVAPEILPRIGRLHAEEGMDSSLTFGDPRNSDSDRPRSRSNRQDRQPDGAVGIGTQGAAVFSLLNEPEPVAAADAEFDGRITLKEFEAAADRRFAMLDSKNLGYLSLAGLPKTPIQLEIEKRKKRDRRKAPPASGE